MISDNLIRSDKRFLVALSFPGDHRQFVASVAEQLSARLGQGRILYDKYYEAEFARPNLDTHLQRLYHDESLLVVVFLCSDYERKEWPGLEWRAIRDLLKRKQDLSIMLVRMDNSDVSGVFSIDGYVSAEGREPVQIADLILQRLDALKETSLPSDSVQSSLGETHKSRPREKVPQAVKEAIDRGVDFLNDGYFKKARAEFESALELAEHENQPLAIVDAKEHLALVLCHFEHDFQQAKILLQSCLELLGGTEDDSERADVLERLARVYEDEGDLELSESLLRQSLAISETLRDKHAQAGTLVSLAWTVGRAGRTDEALDLNRKAYDLLTALLHQGKHEGKHQLSFTHTVLGNIFFQRAKIYQRRAQPDEAGRALETAIHWQRKNPPNHELAKLLKEFGEFQLFLRNLNEGIELLHEAATLYQEREMFPEFAECLHNIGRVYASVQDFDQAQKLFAIAASVAIQAGRNQRTAEILASLAHLALEQRDFENAQQLFESAKNASDDSLFQAECLMDESRLACKQGRKELEKQLVEAAVELLKNHVDMPQPEMERARTYLRLGQYLRVLGDFETSLRFSRKACERFEGAHDAFGAANASFEIAGLLDQMGKKNEARQMCLSILKAIEGKPFYEIAAAIDFSLANFAWHEDNNLEEAKRFVRHGIDLCKQHDLPMLAELLLLEDQLETVKRGASGGGVSIEELLDQFYSQIALCPTNREGYVRFWAFCHANALSGALRATLGPNIAVFTSELEEFSQLSAMLKAYRDWSLIIPTEAYPEDIDEIIPFSEKMVYPPDGVALLGIRRNKQGEAGQSGSSSDPAEFWKKVHASPKVRAEFAASRASTGGTLPRYFFISLEGQEEKFGCARAGVWGKSMALPPAVHQLLQSGKFDLTSNKLLFVYYNRGRVEERKRLWYDLAILQRFRCVPVYRAELPDSPDVRVVASSPLTLPIVEEGSIERLKGKLRSVRKGLLELLEVDELDAVQKIYDLNTLVEDLIESAAGTPTIRTVLHCLQFEYEGAKKMHAALVLR